MALSAALRWSGLQTIVRIVVGFASAKVSALYLGPSGIALVGQVGNLMQVVHGAIGNGAQTAVVQMTAVRHEKHQAVGELWSTALVIVVGLSSTIALISLFASRAVSTWLLSSEQYGSAVAL